MAALTPQRPGPAQAAWNEFTDALKRIGAKIVEPTGARNERERAEGYRYLLRLIAAAHELEMEADARHPTLTRMMTPIRKFKGDGTDTLYHEAKLDERLEYALTVSRGDDLFFSATVYARDDSGAYSIIGTLIDDDMAWQDTAGRSEATIHISTVRPPGAANWVELRGARPALMTRQYFADFVHETDAGRHRPATMRIECVSRQGAPAPFGEADLAAGLRRVTDFVEDAADVSLGLSIFAGLNLVSYEKTRDGHEVDATHIAAGRMTVDDARHDAHTPAELAAMIDPRLIANNLPGPGIQYLGAWFRLRDDEAIEIAGRALPCRYWSCQILTRYLESGDYRHHRVGINDRQVKLRDDGTFVIHASHENPGVDNWISTQGYENGHILVRTLLADAPMQARFRVVKIRDIRR